jgi:TQO small subunit DoxD
MRIPASVAQGILASAALAFLRVYLGMAILIRGWDELRAGAAPLVSLSLSWVGVVLGVALMVGCLTRLTAAVVLVLSISNLVQAGRGEWSLAGSDATFAAISIALLLGAAGRTAGLDALLARRWPRSPLW